MRVVNLVNLQMAIFQGWRGEQTLFVALHGLQPFSNHGHHWTPLVTIGRKKVFREMSSGSALESRHDEMEVWSVDALGIQTDKVRLSAG